MLVLPLKNSLEQSSRSLLAVRPAKALTPSPPSPWISCYLTIRETGKRARTVAAVGVEDEESSGSKYRSTEGARQVIPPYYKYTLNCAAYRTVLYRVLCTQYVFATDLAYTTTTVGTTNQHSTLYALYDDKLDLLSLSRGARGGAEEKRVQQKAIRFLALSHKRWTL